MTHVASQFDLLNRISYGPLPEEVSRLEKLGLQRYLDEQLNPDDNQDVECTKRLKAARLKIEYEAGSENGHKWPAKKESRPLICLEANALDLLHRASYENPMDYQERQRPAEEVRAATVLKARYSRWQLREVLAQFWHNHFNVNAFADERIAAFFPLYDKDVIRKHCLGNFREFLEAVATSASMGYYLDNASSRASPANENYARELFELHTLGAEHYFNDLYNRWKDVPGAKEGAAVAYIDQDVYEAARAFSGWTVGDGSDDYKGGHFPKTGQFYYFDGWHDNYQKRVLGAEIEPNQGPMADGRKVLDLVAYHPGTAEHICAKLCRRLVGDHPPPAVVSTAIQVWKDHAKKPFQIRETVRAIISSKEFTQSLSTKLKNPFELVCSILRVTKAEVTPSPNLWSTLHGTGYKLFEYGPPTGHPDREDYWLGTGSLLAKWNLLIFLFQDWMESAKFNLGAQQATARSSAQIVEFWCKRMLGRKPARPIFDGLVDFLRQARGPNFPPGGDQEDLAARLNALVALIALTPDFQYR